MDPSSPVRYRLPPNTPGSLPGADWTKRVIAVGVAGAVALVVLQAVGQAIDFGFFGLRLWVLNCDRRYSAFGLASLVAQLAVAAAVAWRGSCVEQHRRTWFGLAGLVGVLLLIRGLTTFNAAALAVPLGCVFGSLCWLTRRDPASARVAVWAGLGMLAASLLLHKVGLAEDASTASDYTWAYQITGMIKHGAEFAGWMILATGITAGGGDLRLPLQVLQNR
jgi:hypothetical protein